MIPILLWLPPNLRGEPDLKHLHRLLVWVIAATRGNLAVGLGPSRLVHFEATGLHDRDRAAEMFEAVSVTSP